MLLPEHWFNVALAGTAAVTALFMTRLASARWSFFNSLSFSVILAGLSLGGFVFTARWYHSALPVEQHLTGFSFVVAAWLPSCLASAWRLLNTLPESVLPVVDPVDNRRARCTVPPAYGRARRRASLRDYAGALEAYRSYYNEAPGSARPLLEAAVMFERGGRANDAVAVLQEVLQRHTPRERAWSEAALHLASLKEQHFRDRQGGDYLLREVIKRSPFDDYRQLAFARAARIWSPSPVVWNRDGRWQELDLAPSTAGQYTER